MPEKKLALIIKLIEKIPLDNKKEIAYKSLGSYALVVNSATNLAISYYEKALYLQVEPRVDSHYQLFELYHLQGKKSESLKHLEAIVNHPSSFSFPGITFKAGYYLASVYHEKQKDKSIKLYKRLYPLRYMGENREKIVLLSRLIEDASLYLDYKNLYFYYSELSQLTEENYHRDLFFIFGFLYDLRKWGKTHSTNSLTEELIFLGDNNSDKPRKVFLQAIFYYYDNQLERAVTVLKDILSDKKWQIHALYALWNILNSPDDQYERSYYGGLLLNVLFENALYEKAGSIIHFLTGFKKNPLYHYYVAYIAKETGESNKATEHFLKYVDSPSPHELTLFAVAGYFESVGDYSNAIIANKRLLKIYPQSMQYLLYLAYLYSEQKNYMIANKQLDKILEINPFHRDALYRQGLNYYYLKDVAQAQKVFNQLIEYYPQTATYYNFLGYFLAEEKTNLNQAKRLIEKALEFEPDNEAYLDSLAWVFYQLENYNLAKFHIDKALNFMEQKRQKDVIIYHHAGDIYYALKKTKKAKEYWQKGVDLQSDVPLGFLEVKEKESILRKLDQMQSLEEERNKD